jgi:hypothetical protein
MAKSSDPRKDTDLHRDAWRRFERAVDAVAKSPPQPKTKEKREPGKPSPRPRSRQKRNDRSKPE